MCQGYITHYKFITLGLASFSVEYSSHHSPAGNKNINRIHFPWELKRENYNSMLWIFVTLMLPLNKQLGSYMQLDWETQGFISSGHWCVRGYLIVVWFVLVRVFFSGTSKSKLVTQQNSRCCWHSRCSLLLDLCANCQNGTVLQLKASLAASLPAVVKGRLLEGNKPSRSILCQVSDHHDWSGAGPRLDCQGFPSSAEVLPMLLFVCICVFCHNFWMWTMFCVVCVHLEVCTFGVYCCVPTLSQHCPPIVFAMG